ncbi:cytochrome P450 [Mycena floridula]|nr:cytochrome P450 [Mycena floridula]
MSLPHLSLQTVAVVTATILAFITIQARSKRRPPGPRGLPLVGNALQIPLEHTWLTLSQWANKYGDLMHLQMMGKTMVVISSSQIATELLDKRSAIYSDRPSLTMASLSGYGDGFAALPYGERWRRQRKLVTQHFSPAANPEKLEDKVKVAIGRLIMMATYGYHLEDENDPFLTTPLTAMENFSKATAPGAWLVDIIPQLRHLPGWLPGTDFLKQAKAWSEITWRTVIEPYDWIKKNREVAGTLKPNLCDNTFANSPELDDTTSFSLMWASGAMMGGGMDTGVSTIMMFFLAMILHPDVQKKAQQEIDRVIGGDRLPTIQDKPYLPYVQALIAEVHRWNPIFPLGIPHALTQDDVYNGFTLPKGSILIPNIWHMLHDPTYYPDPMVFNPDRYNNMDSEMQKVTDIIFGFGRRSCPGRHFATGSIFAIIATSLATCDIVPACDSAGKPIPPEVGFTSGTIIAPKPFKYNLKPRSDAAMRSLAETTEMND